MNTRLFATLVAALALCVVNVGATDGQTLPSSLPMGNPEVFRSWIVTNQIINVNDGLYYTNTSGLAVGPAGDFGWKTFNTYHAYQQYIATNTYRYFSEERPHMDETKQVRLVIKLEYYIPELSFPAVETLWINTDIGIPSVITSNSFVTAPTTREVAYVHVPGLSQFIVEVAGLYTNSWPAQAGRPIQIPPAGFSPPQFPPELTTNNYVVLNRWYSMGTNNTIISITVNGVTRRYNRFGERLDQSPVISIVNGKIKATFVRGATLILESSPNLTTWTTLTNFSDVNIAGTYSIPIITNQPRMFFRAGAH